MHSNMCRGTRNRTTRWLTPYQITMFACTRHRSRWHGHPVVDVSLAAGAARHFERDRISLEGRKWHKKNLINLYWVVLA